MTKIIINQKRMMIGLKPSQIRNLRCQVRLPITYSYIRESGAVNKGGEEHNYKEMIYE